MRLFHTAVLAFSLASCSKQDLSSDPVETEPSPVLERALPNVDAAAITTEITDLQTLQALESPAAGWSFGAVMMRSSATPLTGPPPSDLAGLKAAAPSWRALQNKLAADIEDAIAPIDRPLVTELKDALQYPAGNVGRRLDVRWLESPDATFSLIGVVNRIDRMQLLPEPSCGEVRFIYRLGYAHQRESGARIGSRLPFTLNVVYQPTETEDCRSVARRWAHPEAEPPTADALLSGPLRDLTFDRIELNAQVVRFPSGLETEFAGQAAYLQRVYRLESGDNNVSVRTKKLENTLDAGLLMRDRVLREAFIEWTQAHAPNIDRGTYSIPEQFLAESALSWSTLGVNRRANRPASAALLAHLEQLPDPLQGDAASFAASRRGLIERLDNGSCTGCHQAGSTAGFHFLGRDSEEAGVTNRLAQPFSPHYAAERLRRQSFVSAVANGQDPPPHRAHSLDPAHSRALSIANQPCLPSEHAGDIISEGQWTCDATEQPSVCEVVARDDKIAINWGQCVPVDPEVTAGLTCRTGSITSAKPAATGLWNQHSYADTVALTLRYELPEDKSFATDSLNCRPTRIGVPLGRTYRRCTQEERALRSVIRASGAIEPDICAVVGGARFDQCAETDFHACMEEIVGRGMVASCSDTQPCREDSICQSIPWQLNGVDSTEGRMLASRGVGFCTPTYFLFQLRLDGHPVPTLSNVTATTSKSHPPSRAR